MSFEATSPIDVFIGHIESKSLPSDEKKLLLLIRSCQHYVRRNPDERSRYMIHVHPLWLSLTGKRDRQYVDPETRPTGPDTSLPSEIMSHGHNLLRTSQESLDCTIQVIGETKELATATALKIDEQTRQLNRLGETVGDIEDELSRAKFVLRRMLRRADHKLLRLLLCFILLGILVIILIKTNAI